MNAKYFRHQADKLEKLACSIQEPSKAQLYFDIVADFRARANELEREDGSLLYMAKGRSKSDGEAEA